MNYRILIFFIFIININLIFSIQLTNRLPEPAFIDLHLINNGNLVTCLQIIEDHWLEPGATVNLPEKSPGATKQCPWCKTDCPLTKQILDNRAIVIITRAGTSTVWGENHTAYIKKINDNQYEIAQKGEVYGSTQEIQQSYQAHMAAKKKAATDKLWQALFERDQHTIVEALSEGADMEATQGGFTPLMMSVANLDIPIASLLLKNRANPLAKVTEGESKGLFPLVLATLVQKYSQLPTSLQLINLLGQYHASANFKEGWGYQNTDLGTLAYYNNKDLPITAQDTISDTIQENIITALENLGARPQLKEYDKCQDWETY